MVTFDETAFTQVVNPDLCPSMEGAPSFVQPINFFQSSSFYVKKLSKTSKTSFLVLCWKAPCSSVATDDAPSCEVPSRRRTIKPPAWQKDYYMF